MKKIETAYMDIEEANLETIKDIIDNLFDEEMSEEWLCLFDDSDDTQPYIQIHSDVEIVSDSEFYIENPEDNNAEENIYLIEYRYYIDSENFKHYRNFILDKKIIFDYFKKYMNDEKIDTKNWFDVTEEFL